MGRFRYLQHNDQWLPLFIRALIKKTAQPFIPRPWRRRAVFFIPGLKFSLNKHILVQ